MFAAICVLTMMFATTFCRLTRETITTRIVDWGSQRRSEVDCSDWRKQRVLFIVLLEYGFVCAKEENRHVMRFSNCVINRNSTHATIISSDDIVRIISMAAYNGPISQEMYFICHFMAADWNHVPKQGVSPLIVEWDVLLADYPRGIYDTSAVEHPNGPGTVYYFTFAPANLKHELVWFRPGEVRHGLVGCGGRGSNVHVVNGTALYKCSAETSLPEFLGCLIGPIGEHQRMEVNKFVSYMAFHGSGDAEIMRNMKLVYSYVGFKSSIRPMEADLRNLDRQELCARLTAEPSFNNLSNDPDFRTSVYASRMNVQGEMQYYPAV